ncbi:MAG: hypothetical protein EBT02_11185 [Planctomycetia bacterium]|nr:hypothetical protein [Planctomycetia bacterium]
MRYQFIVEHKVRWPVKWMCSALQVSMSGFYRWRYRKPSARSRRWQFLLVQIQEIHEQNHKRYGYRRIHNELEKNTTRKPSGSQSNKAEIQGRKVKFSLVGRHDRNRNTGWKTIFINSGRYG